MNGNQDDVPCVRDNWLVRSLGGVNILTLIAMILAGAKLYFDLDKEIAVIKHDLVSIERRLDDFSRTLTSIRDELRRTPPRYSWPQADPKKFGG